MRIHLSSRSLTPLLSFTNLSCQSQAPQAPQASEAPQVYEALQAPQAYEAHRVHLVQ